MYGTSSAVDPRRPAALRAEIQEKQTTTHLYPNPDAPNSNSNAASLPSSFRLMKFSAVASVNAPPKPKIGSRPPNARTSKSTSIIADGRLAPPPPPSTAAAAAARCRSRRLARVEHDTRDQWAEGSPRDVCIISGG
jgi:hypothetical protein